MKIREIVEALNKAAPEILQEKWDNSGIQLNCAYEKDIKNILVCLEISDTVIAEALELNADMIITHHPLIFGSINKIDCNNIIGNQIINLLSHQISVYSAHTSFDSAENGTNKYLAERLKLRDIKPLVPAEMENCGMGCTGSLETVVSFADFIGTLKSACGNDELRMAGKMPETVRRVALCTGSGSEFMDLAHENGADLYITGDVKYHDARHADDMGFCVIDAGHYGTEIIFADNMAAQLQESIGKDVKITASKVDIYPFRRLT